MLERLREYVEEYELCIEMFKDYTAEYFEKYEAYAETRCFFKMCFTSLSVN